MEQLAATLAFAALCSKLGAPGAKLTDEEWEVLADSAAILAPERCPLCFIWEAVMIGLGLTEEERQTAARMANPSGFKDHPCTDVDKSLPPV